MKGDGKGDGKEVGIVEDKTEGDTDGDLDEEAITSRLKVSLPEPAIACTRR